MEGVGVMSTSKAIVVCSGGRRRQRGCSKGRHEIIVLYLEYELALCIRLSDALLCMMTAVYNMAIYKSHYVRNR